jgi:hypothetical protein
MVDERDEQYDGEEGEYHFSDDQVNYEADSDMAKTSAASTDPKTSIKDLIFTKLSQHRRLVIGSVVFLILIVVVYKIVMPTSSVPPTDFTETATPAEPVVAAAQAPKPVQAPVIQPAPPPAAQPVSPQTVQQPPAQAPAAMAAAATQQPVAPIISPPPTAPAGSATAPAPEAGAQTLSPMQQAQIAMMPQGGNIPPTPIPGQNIPAMPVAETPAKNLIERLASLEQQNAAMMNLLQTEYAQKISDYETQNMSSRGKMEELTKRLNRMEATLNQLAQLLQSGGRQAGGVMLVPQPGMMVGVPAEPVKMMEPKTTYSVQAIIPGRAWLKSEAGDTVTVAEGDVLRSYGRVTKIDPYDGIVNIDTGNKVITLSYGMNAE